MHILLQLGCDRSRDRGVPPRKCIFAGIFVGANDVLNISDIFRPSCPEDISGPDAIWAPAIFDLPGIVTEICDLCIFLGLPLGGHLMQIFGAAMSDIFLLSFAIALAKDLWQEEGHLWANAGQICSDL